MLRTTFVRLATATALLGFTAQAADHRLTLPQALAIARERGPTVLAARARTSEARAQAIGASVPLRNPELTVQAGPRFGPETSVDLQVGVAQPFELGGQRAARIAQADAAVARAQAEADEVGRTYLHDVAVAFLRALHADERVRLAQASLALAERVHDATTRRLRAGDAAPLEVNLAAQAFHRARAELGVAEVARIRALGELRVLLALDPADSLAVVGDLRERRVHARDTLLVAAQRRPDLRALEAEERAAHAERRLGKAQAWPDIGLGIAYGREDDVDIVLGQLSVTLPLFERGQERRAAGTARAARVVLERDVARRALAVRLGVGLEAELALHRSLDILEREVLPRLEQNEDLSRRAFEAGQIGLTDLLVVRREALDARAAYIDDLLAAGLTGVELEAEAGVLP